MGVFYSRHARDRMVQRSISDSEVEEVLSSYDIEYPDREGNRVLIGRPEGRRIKVVVRKDSNPPFVITVAD